MESSVELQRLFQQESKDGLNARMSSDLYSCGWVYRKEYTEWLERRIAKLTS